MPDKHRMIFRADAVRRYLQGKEESVLPRFVSPRIFRYLWIFAVLFGLGCFLTWWMEVPVFVSGPAIIVSGEIANAGGSKEPVLIMFLPSDSISHLQVGQQLYLKTSEPRNRLVRRVTGVEKAVSSPAEARKRFKLPPAAAGAVEAPSAVAIAELPRTLDGLPATKHIGSVYDADIKVGARRLISFLPLIGQYQEGKG
jgi:hypothetical protein